VSTAMRLSRSVLITIWGIAIFVTLISGDLWSVHTPETPDWKFNIQLPGSMMVLYLGWFIGPLQIFMSPLVVGILTILMNVGIYYAVVKTVFFFFFREKLKRGP
jgi:hypothetical protein